MGFACAFSELLGKCLIKLHIIGDGCSTVTCCPSIMITLSLSFQPFLLKRFALLALTESRISWRPSCHSRVAAVLRQPNRLLHVPRITATVKTFCSVSKPYGKHHGCTDSKVGRRRMQHAYDVRQILSGSRQQQNIIQSTEQSLPVHQLVKWQDQAGQPW